MVEKVLTALWILALAVLLGAILSAVAVLGVQAVT